MMFTLLRFYTALITFPSALLLSAHATLPKSAAQQPSVEWQCTDPEWVQPPTLEEDILISRVRSTCALTGVPDGGVARLFKFIKSDVENSGRYTIHAPVQKATSEGASGYRYDLTDLLQEESEALSIRQDMFLGLEHPNRLLYETKSTQVKAGGKAGYLRKVTFRTDLSPNRVQFENEVHVERPWYAFPPFLFRSIGKNITKEKFIKARDKLLGYLAPHTMP